MSYRSRAGLAACWLLVAGLLVRMAWGGSLFGIAYVLRVVHPVTLIVGACAVLIAAGVTIRVLTRPSRGTLWVSVGLSLLVVPFSLVLVGDGHGSAAAVGGSAAAALGIATHALGRSTELATSTAVTPKVRDTGDQRPG